MSVVVRPVAAPDREAWEGLYRGYAAFYEVPVPDLDDLYVDPSARGRGVGGALLDAAAVLAHARGWSIVRWMTAESNVTAQALYDQVANRVVGWATYDMDVTLDER